MQPAARRYSNVAVANEGRSGGLPPYPPYKPLIFLSARRSLGLLRAAAGASESARERRDRRLQGEVQRSRVQHHMAGALHAVNAHRHPCPSMRRATAVTIGWLITERMGIPDGRRAFDLSGRNGGRRNRREFRLPGRHRSGSVRIYTHAFSSCFSSFRKRQSVLVARTSLGLVAIMPNSFMRSA